MTNRRTARRRRGVELGLLLALLLALGAAGYALSGPSPSAPAASGKPSATPSSQVLAPTTVQTAAPSTTSPTGSSTAGTSSGSSSGSTSQLVLAPAASSNGNGNGNGNNCLDPASESSACPHSFGVTVGQAPLLYPGLVRSLPVTFSNPNNFDILVTSYRVSVSVPATKVTTCPASNLQVPAGTITLSPRLTAPKNRSVTMLVPIKLSAGAPEACQQVSFTITLNASAAKK